MDEIQLMIETRRLQRHVSRFLGLHKDWSSKLCSAFRTKAWRGVFFGGLPRGLHRRFSYEPRDLDIVIADRDFDSFHELFLGYVTRKTRFGGIHLEWTGLEIDAWPLSATWAFTQDLVKSPSFDSLTRTTFFDADSVAIEIVPQPGRSRLVYESGYFEAWSNRVLDILLEPNPFPELCVVRGFKLAETYGFSFSSRLTEYCLGLLSRIPLKAFEDVQAKHYGGVYYDQSTLEAIRIKLDQSLSNDSTANFSPFVLTLGDASRHPKRRQKPSFRDPF